MKENAMKILGISGSPRKESQSGVYKLVQTVLENTGVDYELISLRKKTITGCIACLGCVKDNVCKVEDDLTPLREKIVAADAYVFGSPNYYATLNATTHALLERWFQFRHQTGNLLWGKLAVAAVAAPWLGPRDRHVVGRGLARSSLGGPRPASGLHRRRRRGPQLLRQQLPRAGLRPAGGGGGAPGPGQVGVRPQFGAVYLRNPGYPP